MNTTGHRRARYEMEIADLKAALDRIKTLHSPRTLGDSGTFCEHCEWPHPCPTTQTLEGENQ